MVRPTGRPKTAAVADDNEAPPAKRTKETQPKAKKVAEPKASSSSSAKPKKAETQKKPKKEEKPQKVYASKEEEEADLAKKARFRKLMQRKPPAELWSKFPIGKKDCFAGKSFVVTGVLEHFKRDTFESGIKKHGGTVQKAITKTKTNYLIAGRDCGEKKLADAEKFGVQVLSEEEFYEMLKATNPDANKSEEEEEEEGGSSEEHDESSEEHDDDDDDSIDEEDVELMMNRKKAMMLLMSKPK